MFRRISEIRENLSESRYYIYLYVAPSKILLFVVLAAAVSGLNVIDFLENALEWWNAVFAVTVSDVSALLMKLWHVFVMKIFSLRPELHHI